VEIRAKLPALLGPHLGTQDAGGKCFNCEKRAVIA
jgi:hypothetical protein